MRFTVTKKSTRSSARLGILETSHGIVETPALVPVATQAVVKTLTSEEAKDAKCQILIANTFHLHLKPGEEIVKDSGGLHKFMNWDRPLMTDSGGFQVFSLGFGHDLEIGKILKYFPGKKDPTIKEGTQPKKVKITGEGVRFHSPVDGKELFIGPKESMKIQASLGADIIFAFDECTPPLSTREYVEKSLERTHAWVKVCKESHQSSVISRQTKSSLFGIVQGSKYQDLRQASATFINSLGFDGFGIGGDLGESKTDMAKILDWTIHYLNDNKPRHLLGIGYLEDMEEIIKAGIDLFDCTVPTHYGRRGIAFTSQGRLNLNQAKFLKDKNPLDKKCSCNVCQIYRRNYITHLLRAKEITALRLLTFHNLYFFNTFVENLRQKIKDGKI